MFYALTPQYSNIPIFELVNEQTIFNLKTKKDEIKTREKNEWLGVGMPDIPAKTQKNQELDPLIAQVKVFNGGKHLNVPISIDWDINCFKMESKLKHFLLQQEIKTLSEFLTNYFELYAICPEKVKLELENFNEIINNVIWGKIYPKETFHRIKKIHTNNNRKPNIRQRAFMNALYFFEKIFRKFEDFKKYIRIKAIELNIKIDPDWI